MEQLDYPPIAPRRSILPPDERVMIVHDLLGALSGVTGGIAAIDRARLDPQLTLQVERIAAAAEAVARIVESTLAPSRPGGDQPGAVDVAWLKREIPRRWAGEAASKGAALRVEGEGDLPASLAVDPTDLMRVLANLLGNAVKFSEGGTIVFALRRRSDGGLLLSVRDEGPGLGECDPARIFEYGYRGSGKGEGIGLHIARSLAERMGAALSVANALGGGVEARLDLPARLCVGASAQCSVAQDAAQEGPNPAQDRVTTGEAAPGPMPDLSDLRLLLVEDNATNRLVASEMLAGMGAVLCCAADGLEALEIFDKERFDLVLVDIEMPRLSGLDVIRTIRARRDARARTPIVALTAYAMPEHRLRIAEVGADGLISKPIFDAGRFGHAVLDYLRQRPRGESEERALAEEPVIDEAVFLTLASTIGPELMAELLDRIVIDLENVRDGLAAAQASADAGGIRAQSHILISVAGAFGAVRLRMSAAQLNAAAHGEGGEGAAADVVACLDEIGPALAYVKEQRARC